MRRVVHVGPLMAPGGMSSVIKLLAANPPKGWRASSCNTYYGTKNLDVFHEINGNAAKVEKVAYCKK